MRRLPTTWAAPLDGLLHALWPPCCLLCDAPIDGHRFRAACLRCWRMCARRTSTRSGCGKTAHVGPPCPRCDRPRPPHVAPGNCPDCRRRPLAFSSARFGALYHPPLDEAILRFKYAGAHRAGRFLARLARHAADRLPCRPDQIGAVVPVPMDPLRRLRRPVDPARYFAASLARHLGRPLRPAHLVARAGPRQARLTRRERLANARERFDPGRPCPRTVLLVDDVWTTGATADACARALRDAGARTVYFVAAARRC